MSLIVDINPVPWEILEQVKARLLKNRATKQKRQPEKGKDLRRVMQVDNGILTKQRWEEPSFIGGGKTPYIAIVMADRRGYYVDIWQKNRDNTADNVYNRHSEAIDFSFYINKYQAGETSGYPNNYEPTRTELGKFQLSTQASIGDYDNNYIGINHAEGFLFIWSADLADHDLVKDFALKLPNLTGWQNESLAHVDRNVTKWTVFVINENEPQPNDYITLSGTQSYGIGRGYLYFGFVENLDRLEGDAIKDSQSSKFTSMEGKAIFNYFLYSQAVNKFTENPLPYSFIFSKDFYGPDLLGSYFKFPFKFPDD